MEVLCLEINKVSQMSICKLIILMLETAMPDKPIDRNYNPIVKSN
jgi:hypothetical protein